MLGRECCGFRDGKTPEISSGYRREGRVNVNMNSEMCLEWFQAQPKLEISGKYSSKCVSTTLEEFVFQKYSAVAAVRALFVILETNPVQKTLFDLAKWECHEDESIQFLRG